MRLLLDQDVYESTRRFLRALKHDVARVGEIGLATSADEQLLEIAGWESRILITRDRDFGNLVFVRGIRVGVVYLRMLPSTQDSVHNELEIVLESYSEEELRQRFVVVEPGRHRVRKIPDD